MMMSSNGNIFRVTGCLCGEFTGPGEFPAQRPVTRSFDVFFDLRLNKRLSKQPWAWWFETPSWSLWRHGNAKCPPPPPPPPSTADCLIWRQTWNHRTKQESTTPKLNDDYEKYLLSPLKPRFLVLIEQYLPDIYDPVYQSFMWFL